MSCRDRMKAQERGMILNEYNVTPVGTNGVKGDPLPVTSEQGPCQCILFAVAWFSCMYGMDNRGWMSEKLTLACVYVCHRCV